MGASATARAADGDLRTTVRQFGLGIMAFIVSDAAVDFYGALAGELRRHADLARRFYAFGPGRTRANLAAILAAAAARGEVDVPDPEAAAEHLFGLWQGFSNFQLALGVEAAAVRATLAARVDRGVDVFLRAYAPPPPGMDARPPAPPPAHDPDGPQA